MLAAVHAYMSHACLHAYTPCTLNPHSFRPPRHFLLSLLLWVSGCVGGQKPEACTASVCTLQLAPFVPTLVLGCGCCRCASLYVCVSGPCACSYNLGCAVSGIVCGGLACVGCHMLASLSCPGGCVPRTDALHTWHWCESSCCARVWLPVWRIRLGARPSRAAQHSLLFGSPHTHTLTVSTVHQF